MASTHRKYLTQDRRKVTKTMIAKAADEFVADTEQRSRIFALVGEVRLH